MLELVNALETLVKDSVMDQRMRREMLALCREGRQLHADEKAAAEAAEAAYRAKIDNAKLPECDGFEGTGTRCTKCRIRKAMHD